MSEARDVEIGDLDWTDFDIPGGNMPVRLVTMRVEPATNSRTVFVYFPEGWTRAQAGSYACAEEVVVIDGAFEMNREMYSAGEWAYVGSGVERRLTKAAPYALALSRFDGPVRWNAGPGSSPDGIDHRALTVETRGGANSFGA
ncbi:MAG: hypothetical protein LC750_12645, partial [Actinobacteria bacterium]|nr:hypothetical protein [Actinomycetota bacterium]